MAHSKLFLVAALLLGCGSNVSLGDNTEERWRDASVAVADRTVPSTVYEGALQVVGFTVDDSDLYVLLENYHADSSRLELVTCPVDQCGSQRRTLFSTAIAKDRGVLSKRALVHIRDQLFWLTEGGTPANAIARCSTLGCQDGPELVYESSGIALLAGDQDFLYWAELESQQIVRRAVDSVAPPQSLYGWEFWPPGDQPSLIEEYADYLYWINDKGISRLPKDGSHAPELIVSELGIGGLSVSAGGLYFSTRVLTGRLLHCPLSGCPGKLEELVTGQRWPTSVYADSEQVYWINAQRSNSSLRSDSLVTSFFGEGRTQILASDVDFDTLTDINDALDQWDGAFAVNRRRVFWRESQSYDQHFLRSLAR